MNFNIFKISLSTGYFQQTKFQIIDNDFVKLRNDIVAKKNLSLL